MAGLVFSSPVSAAKAPDPYCTLTTTQFVIYNLDPDVPFSATYIPYPVGTVLLSNPDGTYTVTGTWTSPTTIYVWVRGHGPSLIKGSKQIGDYHVVAICSI